MERNLTHTELRCLEYAAEINYAKSVKAIQDSARTTWIAYQSAQSRVSYVNNQVEIARQFLALAQREAQKARGQMMLVVNAQNALVNAQKDLENANTDFAMQVFSMLAQANALSLDSLRTAAVAEAEAVQEARKQYQQRLKNSKMNLKKPRKVPTMSHRLVTRNRDMEVSLWIECR